MIARQWHGRVRLGEGDRYNDYIMRTGIADFQAVPGNLGVMMFRHDDAQATHFTVTSFWDSLEAVKIFAGEDYERARYYPQDDEFLLEREPHVRHYEVAFTTFRG